MIGDMMVTLLCLEILLDFSSLLVMTRTYVVLIVKRDPGITAIRHPIIPTHDPRTTWIIATIAYSGTREGLVLRGFKRSDS